MLLLSASSQPASLEVWTGILIPLLAAVLGAVAAGMATYIVEWRFRRFEFQSKLGTEIDQILCRTEEATALRGALWPAAVDEGEVLMRRAKHIARRLGDDALVEALREAENAYSDWLVAWDEIEAFQAEHSDLLARMPGLVDTEPLEKSSAAYCRNLQRYSDAMAVVSARLKTILASPRLF